MRSEKDIGWVGLTTAPKYPSATYKLLTPDPLHGQFYSDECAAAYQALDAIFGNEEFTTKDGVESLQAMLYMKKDRAEFLLPYMANKGFMKKVE